MNKKICDIALGVHKTPSNPYVYMLNMLIIFAINSSLFHDTQRETHPKAESANADMTVYNHTYTIIYDLYTIFIGIFKQRDLNDIWYINIFVEPGPRHLKIENPTPDSYNRIVSQHATTFLTTHIAWSRLNDFVITVVRSSGLAPLTASSPVPPSTRLDEFQRRLKTAKTNIDRLGGGGSHTRKKHRMKYKINNTKRRFTKEKLCMTRKRART